MRPWYTVYIYTYYIYIMYIYTYCINIRLNTPLLRRSLTSCLLLNKTLFISYPYYSLKYVCFYGMSNVDFLFSIFFFCVRRCTGSPDHASIGPCLFMFYVSLRLWFCIYFSYTFIFQLIVIRFEWNFRVLIGEKIFYQWKSFDL